jgi:hypothetical protein
MDECKPSSHKWKVFHRNWRWVTEGKKKIHVKKSSYPRCPMCKQARHKFVTKVQTITVQRRVCDVVFLCDRCPAQRRETVRTAEVRHTT